MDIDALEARYRFSRQELIELGKIKADQAMWGIRLPDIDTERIDHATEPQRAGLAMRQIRERYEAERQRPTPYGDFTPPVLTYRKPRQTFTAPPTFMGRCPCPTDGRQTRCCNLRTLDAVQQCGFSCSYCAIQTFYGRDEVKIVGNLKERLETIELDPGVWHIGTGQSSDSLLWGNDWGTLDALKTLARRYPDVVIELKTKSARTDWCEDPSWPKNLVATWSLQAPVIAEKEELLTASTEARLRAARKAADHHIPIGFHIHPMVWFEGWDKAYPELVRAIASAFRPEELVMLSMGTLTFTRSVLKAMRAQGRPTRILDMDLVPFAGKYSYPFATKQALFRAAYDAFPASWKTGEATNPFFYLCFEDPALWQPVFGYAYPTNEAFEDTMHRHYLATIERFRGGA